MIVVVLNVVNVFSKAIPCCFRLVELSGNHVEPCVRLVDLFDAQGDHAAQVVLGADGGKVVCHGVTLVELAFSVYFFFTFFSIEIPSRAVREHPHTEGTSVAAVRCLDSTRLAERSLEAHVGVGVNLTRTIESVELIASHDGGGDSVDVDREVHFVLHGHTMG